MPQTLVLVFHPDLSQSKANAALAKAAATLPGVEVVNMQAIYPGGQVGMTADADVEVARLLAADRIVMQFPIQWYATPALLKSWFDAVLTRMYYINYESEGRLMEGKPVLIAVTAGNTAESYTPGGRNRFTVDDMLVPLRMTTNRCGLVWAAPFVVFEANKLTPDRHAAAAASYRDALSSWQT